MKIRLLSSQLVLSLAMAITLGQVQAQDINLEEESAQVAYSIGANIGQNLQAQGITAGIDVDVFMVGLRDALAGDMKMTPEQMMAAIQLFMEQQQSQQQAALDENLAVSEEFLAANAQIDGVVTLGSGLQYMILESGPADGAPPTTSNSVLAHYHGTLIDGSVFDSSVERGQPATFGVSQVIAGWTEALQLMRPGDKWRLFIPPGLAYGTASPTPTIPPNSALIFEVELLEVR